MVLSLLWFNLSLYEGLDVGVSAALPLALVFLGYIIQRAQAQNDHRRWISQKLIEKRIEVLSELGPHLNDLFCFFTWKGHWRTISPEQALATKRKIGNIFHVNRYFFSPEIVAPYKAFTDACFERERGPGLEAGLKTNIVSRNGDRRTYFQTTWDPKWEDLFIPCDHEESIKTVERAYDTLMRAFRDELDEARRDRPRRSRD